MRPRALALVMVVAALVLLGATAADWAVVATDRTIEADGVALDVADSEVTSGADVAGGLLVIGLVALVGAGLTAWRPLLGSVQLPLGALAAVEAVGAVRSLDGVTAAPVVAAVAGAVLVAAGTEAVRVGVAGPDAGPGDRDAGSERAPSRYTVESATGATEDPDDEWDAAVADDGPGEPAGGDGR